MNVLSQYGLIMTLKLGITILYLFSDFLQSLFIFSHSYLSLNVTFLWKLEIMFL